MKVRFYGLAEQTNYNINKSSLLFQRASPLKYS